MLTLLGDREEPGPPAPRSSPLSVRQPLGRNQAMMTCGRGTESCVVGGAGRGFREDTSLQQSHKGERGEQVGPSGGWSPVLGRDWLVAR